MQQSSSAIHVAIAFDEGYVTPVYVFLTSLFTHNTDSKVVVHAIATGVSDQQQAALQEFGRAHRAEIRFYTISPALTANFPMPDRPGAYMTVATYYRLFFPALVDQAIPRLLYLDVDTLIVGSLAAVYNYPLHGHVVGAVQEAEMEPRPDIEFPDLTQYFNAGVLLMDLVRWREQAITKQALTIIAAYGDKLRYHDQDTLNLVFRGNWERLPAGFNLMKAYIPHDLPRHRFTEYLRDKVVIHYNGALKPWHWACENRFRYLYPRYLAQSPRAGSPRYVPRSLDRAGWQRLFRNRALELYFNYPVVGTVWRGLKQRLGRS